MNRNEYSKYIQRGKQIHKLKNKVMKVRTHEIGPSQTPTYKMYGVNNDRSRNHICNTVLANKTSATKDERLWKDQQKENKK